MDKPKPFTGVMGVVASIMAANAARRTIHRTPAGTKRGRQFASAKGTGAILPENLNKPHVGKKQIAKELKRLEKLANGSIRSSGDV